MLAGHRWDDWIERYGRSHRHPFNQRCHLLGIPLITVALPLAAAGALLPALGPVLLPIALLLFALGWALQFLGHAVEGKPPEFLQDPCYLLVGLGWWLSKLRDRSRR